MSDGLARTRVAKYDPEGRFITNFAVPGAANAFGIKVLCDEEGNNGFTIASGKGKKTLTVDYSNPPFELQEGEDLTLRVFIDKNLIEVFANDRQAALAWHEYDLQDLHVSLFSKGGDLKVKNVSAWQMKSIW